MTKAKHILFFQREHGRVAIILSSAEENKINYILSLGCFSKGFLGVIDIIAKTQLIIDPLVIARDNENYLDAFIEHKDLCDIYSCVFIYCENDVILRPIRKQLEKGEFPIASSSKVRIVTQ